MSVWPSRHARPEVSVTTTPTLVPVRSVHLVAQRARRGVGVEGQEHDRPGSHVGGVDPGGGHGEAETVAHDGHRPAPRDDADRLLLDGRVAVARAHPPLGLAHHLAGHAQHVAVGETVVAPEGVEHDARQVVALDDLGHPVGGPHLEPAAHAGPGVTSETAAAAIAAVASWSDIMRGTAAARSPACSSPATCPASRSSTSQPSSTPPADRAP